MKDDIQFQNQLPNQLLKSISEPDTLSQSSFEAAPDAELLAQVNRVAGGNHLKELYSAGLLKHSDEPEHDIAASMLAYPDYSKKSKAASPLRVASSEKLAKRLNQFIEGIGASPPITDEKGAQKLLAKAQMFLMKTPGFPKMKADDKTRVVHRILKLAGRDDLNDLHEIIEHENKYSKSRDSLTAKIESLFGDSYPHETPVSDDERSRVKEYVDNNEFEENLKEKYLYADGGEINHPKHIVHDRVATAYPEQAAMLTASRQRIHNYLNSVKPQKPMALPFDKTSPDKIADKRYHEAVDVAARPLHVLDAVKKGSLGPSQIKDFAAMHPELHDLLKKKLTGELVKHQVDENKRPPFKVRQAMSLFMMAPLEKTFTPEVIQAAQATFQPAQPPPQQASAGKGKAGKGGSVQKLGKSIQSDMTPVQAAEKATSTHE